MSSLYVHIPFCDKKCFYCSFVVSVGQQKRVDQYLQCVIKEMKDYSPQVLETIYLGGGTPTALNPEQLVLLFEGIKKNFDCSKVSEITVEANPEGLTIEKLQALKKCGVTRLSLGVQSMNQKYLSYSGRAHNIDQVYEAIKNVRNQGFDNINLDLMFGFPSQTNDEVLADVDSICSLGSEHLSIYALTIEENSRFYTKKVQLLADQAQSEQYGLIMKRAYEHGFLQYEVSNFAKEGCQSVHNQKYWQCKDCIGLGVGAHGFINARRYSNESRLIDYIKLIESDEEIISYTESLTVEQQFNEAVVFGLRMNKGIVLKDIEEYYDFQLREDKRNKINHMIAEDLLVHEEDFLRVTDKGRYVLDSISAELI